MHVSLYIMLYIYIHMFRKTTLGQTTHRLSHAYLYNIKVHAICPQRSLSFSAHVHMLQINMGTISTSTRYTYVRNTVCRYSTRYAKSPPCIDKYWISFWSPNGSRWELKANFNHFSAWTCVSCLLRVFHNRWNTKYQQIFTKTDFFFFWKGMSLKKHGGKPETP